MDHVIPTFLAGTHNLLEPENIPKDAAQDAQNFLTQDGKIVLVGGRELLGAAGTVGGTTGLHKGYKVNGDSVIYCKRGTAIMYWDGGAWQNSITGLSATDDYTFANYSSLAGAFTYVNGPGGFWKIVNANPGSPVDVFSSTKNFKGYIIIDRGRCLLWNRDRDKTGLYGSKIDPQDATVYTTVSNEAIGVSGSTTYTGTLAFKAGGAARTCFGVAFDATVAAGTETFTDNFNGVLTSNFGGTGTINYATGAYSVTFSDVTTGAVQSDYQWEDSTVGGIADFTKSPTRLAGEGFVFPQDEGGDAILKVEIGQDGVYYSMKSDSVYSLSIDADDLGADNKVFRKDIGIAYFRGSTSTNKGILFMNTFNPTKPEMTLLEQNTVSLTLLPKVLFKHFRFSDYVYDHSSFGSYDRWMIVFCRTPDSLVNNRMLMCDIEKNTVDIVAYTGNASVQEGETLYVADSASYSVHSTFSGFDDLGSAIDAYWVSKNDVQGTEDLKKARKIRFKGRIDPDQAVQVYINTDEQGDTLVGTIVGTGSYVASPDSQAIGGPEIGEGEIGGETVAEVGKYFLELRMRTGKYRSLSLRLVPTGIGYFDAEMVMIPDILTFEPRIPSAFRSKQNVSLDGLQTDV
jgi:hypothetical protein